MTTLTEFVLSRIAEDEAAARAVLDSHEMWGWGSYVASAGMYDKPASDFAVRHDPARVLAQCAALHEVVALHSGGHECPGVGQVWWDDDADWTQPCPTLRAVASIWAGHESYDPEWRLT